MHSGIGDVRAVVTETDVPIKSPAGGRANDASRTCWSDCALRACFAAGTDCARDEFMGAALCARCSDYSLRTSFAGGTCRANNSGCGAALRSRCSDQALRTGRTSSSGGAGRADQRRTLRAGVTG